MSPTAYTAAVSKNNAAQHTEIAENLKSEIRKNRDAVKSAKTPALAATVRDTAAEHVRDATELSIRTKAGKAQSKKRYDLAKSTKKSAPKSAKTTAKTLKKGWKTALKASKKVDKLVKKKVVKKAGKTKKKADKAASKYGGR